MNKINELKKIIDQSKGIVFFTGAGISVPSGIPDFRSAKGLYNKHLGAEDIISHHYFMDETKAFYQFYKDKMVFVDAKPNLAHKWIADLEKEGKVLATITQNIDGLHSLAGSKKVIELHGSIYRNYCMECGKSYPIDTILASDLPRCECGGIIKPDVVLYEEALKSEDIENAINLISHSDTLIIIGTSLKVYPAAGFIRYFRGNKLIVINKEHHIDFADLCFDNDVIDVIKALKETCE